MKILPVSSTAVMSLFKGNSTPSIFKPSTLNTDKARDFIVTISSEARIKQIQGRANSTANRLIGAPTNDREYVPPHGTMFRRKIRIKI